MQRMSMQIAAIPAGTAWGDKVGARGRTGSYRGGLAGDGQLPSDRLRSFQPKGVHHHRPLSGFDRAGHISRRGLGFLNAEIPFGVVVPLPTSAIRAKQAERNQVVEKSSGAAFGAGGKLPDQPGGACGHVERNGDMAFVIGGGQGSCQDLGHEDTLSKRAF